MKPRRLHSATISSMVARGRSLPDPILGPVVPGRGTIRDRLR